MAKMPVATFVAKAKDAALNHKTLYVMGCFGAPMNATNKARYTGSNAHDYNRRPERTAMINAATEDTFGFDCVCLIKGILWGWKGDKNAVYGGASYASNGVPDLGADTMIKVCSGVSSNFSKIEPGEVVWKSGHIGIYIGDGLAVECTPAWKNQVQITAVANIGRQKAGYAARSWTKHGKLPYVDYTPVPAPAPKKNPFTDVKEGAYYSDAVQWAWENGITAGTTPTTFAPDKPCTRGEMVVFLKRLAELLGKA